MKKKCLIALAMISLLIFVFVTVAWYAVCGKGPNGRAGFSAADLAAARAVGFRDGFNRALEANAVFQSSMETTGERLTWGDVADRIRAMHGIEPGDTWMKGEKK